MLARGIETLDRLALSSVLAYRVKVSRESLEWLLNHRDVRRVDLPPRWEVSRADLADRLFPLPNISRADNNSERVAVLDTGVLEGHPLIAPALGDAQTFYSAAPLSPTDDHGHGTFVSALAAFGDLHHRILVGLSCEVVLLSGRVLDAQAEYLAGVGIDLRYDARIIANDVRRAVDEFLGRYGCKVYCLSFGDKRHPYRGGHLDGLAVALDEMAREFGCLFIVAAGNILREAIPADCRETYPDYLFDLNNRIVDPATAINVITVGSIARREATDYQARYQSDIRHTPIARLGQPSPFTRSGPTVAGILKPDVVFYGGNLAVNMAATDTVPLSHGLGEVSAALGATSGQLLCEMSGTSAATPVIAHLAARLTGLAPQRDAMLARAMIAAHSVVPRASRVLFGDNREQLNNALGYGVPDMDAALRSTNRVLTLFSRDSISNGTNHFYEIPIPVEFFVGARRRRSISVALSHFATVRSSRLQYKEQRLSFKLVAGTLDYVVSMFDAATEDQDYENIPEVSFSKSMGSRRRSRGTLQSCTYYLTEPRDVAQNLILVVTRNDRPWATGADDERYALAIVVDDRLNADARLHAYAQSQVQVRLRR